MKNVVWIDDSPVVGKNVKTFNRLADIYEKEVRFHYGSDGVQGLEVIADLESKDGSVDMIFLDLDMPVMSGDNVLENFVENGRNYPVVVTSMVGDAVERVERTGYENIVGYSSIITDQYAFKSVGEDL